jgi:RNA polymerase sigma factor (sigma-70 family)
MKALMSPERMTAEQDQRITETVRRERTRLRNFIRRRVRDEGEAEDILQDVFSELVEAYRLMKPIEQAGAWLFRVARNRIIDKFRRKRREVLSADLQPANEDEPLILEELLASSDAGPEAAYARTVLMEQIESALDELPEEQLQVFVAHEIEGRSFKELAAETGVNVNTLLSRKRYAAMHLRKRLEAIHKEFIEG